MNSSSASVSSSTSIFSSASAPGRMTDEETGSVLIRLCVLTLDEIARILGVEEQKLLRYGSCVIAYRLGTSY